MPPVTWETGRTVVTPPPPASTSAHKTTEPEDLSREQCYYTTLPPSSDPNPGFQTPIWLESSHPHIKNADLPAPAPSPLPLPPSFSPPPLPLRPMPWSALSFQKLLLPQLFQSPAPYGPPYRGPHKTLAPGTQQCRASSDAILPKPQGPPPFPTIWPVHKAHIWGRKLQKLLHPPF